MNLNLAQLIALTFNTKDYILCDRHGFPLAIYHHANEIAPCFADHRVLLIVWRDDGLCINLDLD